MRVTTGSRLHFGLIDLHGGIGRVDGGIGLGISEPGVEIEGNLSNEVKVSGPMRERALRSIELVLNEIDGDPINVHITSTIPQHVGLGSGTQIALASAMLASRLNGRDIVPKELANIVNRGGTSGIGTAVFSRGGFILDGGHNFEEKNGYLPSSASDVSPPSVIGRLDFPDWDIRVFIPEGRRTFGSDELQTFEEGCPIPPEDVGQLSRVIIMKLLPAIVESDFSEFQEAISQIQKIGFKGEEIERQPKSKQIVHSLNDQGYAAGMSSMGPAVYAIHPNHVDDSSFDVRSFQTEVDKTGARIIQ